jgi:AcrR family transcriptional regulator
VRDGPHTDPRRADALRNRERILDAAERMLARSRSASLAEIAAAAGVSRSTLHRRFASREALLEALADRPHETSIASGETPLPPGGLGRERPVSLDAIQVFDVVPPALLPEQLVAEAQRIAKVPVALYVLDIDGTFLLHMAGPKRLPEQIETPLAIGPELDADGLADLRRQLTRVPGARLFPLWLRGRANGVLIAFGARPLRSASSRARPRRRRRWPTATPTSSPARSDASSRRRPPRSSRACCRRASRA